jgi:O-antigen ligase
LISALPLESIKWITQFFQLSLLYIIVSLKHYTKKDYNTIITSIIISGLIVSVYIFYNLSQGITTEQERISIATGDRNADPNHVAASMLFPLILLFQSRTNTILKISTISVMLFALLLTGSRGALIGLSCGILYLFFHAKVPIKTKIINALLAILLSIILFVYLLPLLPSAISQRFSMELLISTGGSGRANLWKDAISMFLQKPLWGHGYSLYQSISLYDNAAHNIYIQLLVETGIIGVSLFLTFITSIIRISKANSILAGTIAVLVASTFLGTLGYPYFWLALFVPMIRILEEKEGENNYGNAIF